MSLFKTKYTKKDKNEILGISLQKDLFNYSTDQYLFEHENIIVDTNFINKYIRKNGYIIIPKLDCDHFNLFTHFVIYSPLTKEKLGVYSIVKLQNMDKYILNYFYGNKELLDAVHAYIHLELHS